VFRNVRSCIRRYPAEHDLATVIGADFARKHDFSVFIPMNTKRQAISVAYRAQDDYPIQKARLAAIAVANGFARIVADEASIGDPLIQDLRVAGFQVEGINTNGPVKRSIIENLRLAFEQSTVSIPDDEALIDELEAYEYELLPSGQLRYSAPEGKHDDMVMALALALWGQRGAVAYIGNQTRSGSYLGGTRRGGSYLR
jgi:phage FluMu gp28-like protein